MSSDKLFLALRLEGPLQSWGCDSQYNRRNSNLMPTKSAIAGMCCAALGLSRGSTKEREFLDTFGGTQMTAIAIPLNGVKRELPVRLLQDYHTVQSTRRASGSINNDCVLTQRHYLTDASFGVLLEGDADTLRDIAGAIADPVWGLWLGRKTCIPSAPVLAGLRNNRTDALRLIIGEKPLEAFTRQEEVENFADGRDSIPDMPVSFATEQRSFSLRRVQTVYANQEVKFL